MQKLFPPNEKNNQMPVKHPISNMPSKGGLTHPLVWIYWPDIWVVLVEECDLLIPIFTSLSTSISRCISHSSFLLSINNLSPSLHISHTTHQVLLLSPLLLVINYKVSRQFIALHQRRKKKMIILDQMYVCICGTRHSTVVYWPAENTCQLLLSCYSTVTRQAV